MSNKTTRNPLIPENFTPELDHNGQPTHLYRGPTSRTGIYQAYIFDKGPGHPLEVEYTQLIFMPEMSWADIQDQAEEMFDFSTEVSSWTVFPNTGSVLFGKAAA